MKKNKTLKQEHVKSLLKNMVDSNNDCVVSIHSLGYPVTPESINPAIQDLENLKANGDIQDFIRVSSRVFKIINIQ